MLNIVKNIFLLAFILLLGCTTQPKSGLSRKNIDTNDYLVKNGDSFYSIANRYNVSADDLAQLNDAEPNTSLEAGRTILVPNKRNISSNVKNISPRQELNSLSAATINNKTVEQDNKPIDISNNISRQNLTESNDSSANHSDPIIEWQKTYDLTNSDTKPKEEKAENTTVNISANNQNLTKSQEQPINDSFLKNRHFSTKLSWPVIGKIIARFGPRAGGLYNDGINILAPDGTKVIAVDDGVVVYAGDELKGYGNLVLIKHAQGYLTAYAHNKSNLVKKNDIVRKGDAIAYVGKTGNVTTSQLHFSIRKGKKPVNPEKYLDKLS